MKLVDFFSKYPDEASCKAFFKQRKEKQGLECGNCSSLSHYWIEKESRWKCKGCGKSMSLKTGTVMEHSNLGYKIWLWGLYLMSLTKKGFSALEMQRLLGHKRYEPVWLMMHKIRISMGNRDDSYTLESYIEMDEGFFEGQRKKDILENITVKPVRELDRQVRTFVAVSVAPVTAEKQKKHQPATKCGFVKMNVVNNLGSNDLICAATKMLNPAAIVHTDGKACYNGLKNICAKHEKMIVKDKKQVSKIFPWVHTAISNAKKKILGLHHQVKDAYMQNYLNEFCYKFNRRYFGIHLFDRVLVASLSNPWYKPFPING